MIELFNFLNVLREETGEHGDLKACKIPQKDKGGKRLGVTCHASTCSVALSLFILIKFLTFHFIIV